MLLELLKLLPNLTSLKLSVDDKKSKNFSIEKEAAVFLPKLKHIEINDWDGSKPINLNILKGCGIEEVILDCVSDSISTVALVTFLKSHEQNLKKLCLRSDSTSLNFMDVLASLDNLKLESLNLQSARDDVEKFLIFARKCPSLKTMILWMNPLTDQIINVICDNFKQLGKLQLEGISNMTRISADCFHKLTNLRILDISTITYDFHPLSGFRFQTNKKLEELIVPYYDIPPGFFARLKIYIPNLKKLDCMISTTEVIEKLMEYYEDLEHLSILHGCNWDDEFVQSSLNEKPMLKLKDLYLQGCIRNIDIKTARKIVRIFCNLEYLRIDECGRLSEKAVKVLLRGLKNLKELRLCRIRNQLSDQVLHYLNDYGKKLQIVYLDAEYDLNLVQEILVDKKGLQISGRNFSSTEKDVGERRPYF